MIQTLVFLLLTATMQAPAVQQPPASNDETAPFLIGVLRRDGVVSPFAAFDGKDWDIPWPDDLRGKELPIGLESVPTKWWGKAGAVKQMTAWIDGVSRGPIRLVQPTMVRLMCGPQLGLTSDYHSAQPAPPPQEQPYPKDGLAVSGSQRVEPIEMISPASSEWTSMAAFLIEPFAKAEDAGIAAFTAWNHPVRKGARRGVPIELETMYRAPMDQAGWSAYYVEAIKKYPPGPDDDEDCGLVTSASGWVVAGPDGKRTTKLTARVTYCDRRGVTYMLPLGLIKAHGRTYWAYQLSGYGREGYAIVHLMPKAIMPEVHYLAGSCPMY
jgi:hypothetical protein